MPDAPATKPRYDMYMASPAPPILRVPSLSKREMARLAAKAKDLGLTPEHYARRLIEDGLAVQREAGKMSFGQIMAPVRKAAGHIDDAEIVALVHHARRNGRRGSARGAKR
jgi:hypothetical protein